MSDNSMGGTERCVRCPECSEKLQWTPLVEHVKDEHGWLESDIELLSLEGDRSRDTDT